MRKKNLIQQPKILNCITLPTSPSSKQSYLVASPFNFLGCSFPLEAILSSKYHKTSIKAHKNQPTAKVVAITHPKKLIMPPVCQSFEWPLIKLKCCFYLINDH
jgi:hypothetical protein